MITNILTTNGYCITTSDNACVLLSVPKPNFGCGATYVRIWHASDRRIETCGEIEPDIRLISEL